MLSVLWKVSTMIRLDVVDAAQMAAAVDFVEQPGATLDIVTGVRIDPDRMQLISGAEIEGFYPLEQVVTLLLLPALHIGITDAPLIGVYQIQTAMAAASAVKV
jgi:hypothetical protein